MTLRIPWWMAAWGASAIFGNTAFTDNLSALRTVFVIVLENHDWAAIYNNTNAPYLNQALLPMASFAAQYHKPPVGHPVYMWFEAGTNFGIEVDNPPSINHQGTTNHLATLLHNAGLTWRAYEENISGSACPLTDSYPYVVRHNPFVYFDDVMTNAMNCHTNVRPYSELPADLANNTLAAYNFITPNITNDMHDPPGTSTAIAAGDTWLSHEIPRIMASAAYSNGGAIFITWDEGSSTANNPIGMIVLSPLAKGGGYSNSVYYTHSSLVRTLQDIFQVHPYLQDAANATNLGDLFLNLRWSSARKTRDGFECTLTDLVPGKNTLLYSSSNLFDWVPISTNQPAGHTLTFTNLTATDSIGAFYRAEQWW
jgi:phosphatidylinositol-3-phosphatase